MEEAGALRPAPASTTARANPRWVSRNLRRTTSGLLGLITVVSFFAAPGFGHNGGHTGWTALREAAAGLYEVRAEIPGTFLDTSGSPPTLERGFGLLTAQAEVVALTLVPLSGLALLLLAPGRVATGVSLRLALPGLGGVLASMAFFTLLDALWSLDETAPFTCAALAGVLLLPLLLGLVAAWCGERGRLGRWLLATLLALTVSFAATPRPLRRFNSPDFPRVKTREWYLQWPNALILWGTRVEAISLVTAVMIGRGARRDPGLAVTSRAS